MSDQTPYLGNTRFVPNTGGVATFGKVGSPGRTGAIWIDEGSNITIVEGPNGTYTLNAPNAVTSFQQVGNLARVGAIVIDASAGIGITEAPAQTYTFSNTGVVNFGLTGTPRTGAVVIVAGTNVTIVEAPANTFTINSTGGAGGGITSINGDTTAAQVVAVAAPITIVETGATHTIGVSDYTNVSRGTVPDPSAANSAAFLTKLGWHDADAPSAGTGTPTALTANALTPMGAVAITTPGVYVIAGQVSITGTLAAGYGFANLSTNLTDLCTNQIPLDASLGGSVTISTCWVDRLAAGVTLTLSVLTDLTGMSGTGSLSAYLIGP